MKYTNRQINRINKLAENHKVLFDGGDGLFTVDEIKFLNRREDGADEPCWAVYFDNYRNWYYLQDCKFFTMKQIYGKD